MTDTNQTRVPTSNGSQDTAPEDGGNTVKKRPGGQLLMVVDGTSYLLRCPSMGQMKRYREMLVNVMEGAKERALESDQAKADARAAEAQEPQALAVAHIDATLEHLRSSDTVDANTLGFFELARTLVDDLCATGQKLPDDDDLLPPWLGNVTLYTQMINHWRSSPLVPGR